MREYVEDNILVIKEPKIFHVNFDLPKNVYNVSSMKLKLS